MGQLLATDQVTMVYTGPITRLIGLVVVVGIGLPSKIQCCQC